MIKHIYIHDAKVDGDGNTYDPKTKTLVTRRGKRLQIGQTLRYEDEYSAWAKANHGGAAQCEARITGFGEKNGVAVVDLTINRTYPDGFKDNGSTEWKYASEV